MTWPLAIDYDAAVQTPKTSFADPELCSGTAATNMLGLPLTYAGGFANVYKFECGKNTWALKCFTRQVTDQQVRYAAISQYLANARRKFAVEFQFLDQGIRVKNEWYPAVKMRWVEGFTLNEFLRDHVANISMLEQMTALWLRLGSELRDCKMAHADLQHGNVMLVPGSKEKAIGLRLIDYDGMWVPDLAGKPPGEVGHPNYQHPQRQRESYSAEIDRFSHLVMFTAFRCLVGGGVALWNKFDNSENLLFREADFRDPAKSKLWPELMTLPDANTQALVGHLLAASQGALDKVPLVSDLYAGGKVVPLAPELRELVRDKVPSLRGAKPFAPTLPPPPTDWLPAAGEPVPVGPRKSKAILPPPPAPEPTPVVPVVSIPPVPLDAIPVLDEVVEVIPMQPLPPIPFAVEKPPADLPVPMGKHDTMTGTQRTRLAEVAKDDPDTARDTKVMTGTQRTRLAEVVEDDTEQRTKTRPHAKPADKKSAAPDWLLGLGLSPESPVVRFWPFVLGGVVALPLALVLGLVVWLMLPSKPTPPPVTVRKPALREMPAAELAAGREQFTDVFVENIEPDVTPTIELGAGLPAGVTGSVVPGEASPVRVRLVAVPELGTGSFTVTVRLMHAGTAIDEKKLTVRTRALIRPDLGDVSNIDLIQGDKTDVVVKVTRNGNPDPLTLTLGEMPKGVRVEPLGALGPDHVGMRLTVAADAPLLSPGIVRLVLLADKVPAREKNVSLSLRSPTSPVPKAAPQVLLTLDRNIPVEPSGVSKLQVRLERRNYEGPVVLSAENLPLGMRVAAVTVPANRDFAEMLIEAPANELAMRNGDRIEIVAKANFQRVGSERVMLTLLPARQPDRTKGKEKEEAVTTDKLRGTWKLVRHDTMFNGKGTDTLNTSVVSGFTLPLTGNRLSFLRETNGVSVQAAYSDMTLDGNKQPVTIDLRSPKTKGKSGGAMLGIARIRDKQLELLFTINGAPRPESFDDPPDGAQLMILSKTK